MGEHEPRMPHALGSEFRQPIKRRHRLLTMLTEKPLLLGASVNSAGKRPCCRT